MLLFVYLAMASSGGTIPVQALPSFFRFTASFEPLRQVLGGSRAILCFNAQGDAGRTRGLVFTTARLVFWVIVGTAVTRVVRPQGHGSPPAQCARVRATVRSRLYRGHIGPGRTPRSRQR